MDIAALRAYLLARPGANEDYPFGPEPLVLKVAGKMFALLALQDAPPRISLKCDPLHAQLLREQYPAVQPGYHLDKRHWISVTLDGSISEEELRALIDESYRLVVKGLSKAQRRQLEEA